MRTRWWWRRKSGGGSCVELARDVRDHDLHSLSDTCRGRDVDGVRLKRLDSLEYLAWCPPGWARFCCGVVS